MDFQPKYDVIYRAHDFTSQVQTSYRLQGRMRLNQSSCRRSFLRVHVSGSVHIRYQPSIISRRTFVDYNTRRQGDLIPLDGYRDFVPHAVRRKPWTRALNSSAVKEYEADVHDKVKQLVDSLEAKAEKGEAVNMSDQMSFFAYVLVNLSAV